MKATSFVILSLALAAPLLAADKQPYHLSGIYTDTCTCSVPCRCDLTGNGPDMCKGVGAVAITKGDYSGADLSGVRFAYALDSGNWLCLYIDAPDAGRRASAEKFLRVLCADWGKLESVSDAKVEIAGKDGGYAVQVDGGKVMTFVIAPILGGDGKTPLAHTNTHGAITSTFLQGKSAVVSSYHDGERSFDIPAGRNGYFNDKVESGGSL
jgi:hypothetical protein